MSPSLNIKEKAFMYANHAHIGQVRKFESDKPKIFHLINVAKILEEYEYDDNVIAAGYLRYIFKYTNISKEKIIEEFGEDIYNLVLSERENTTGKEWNDRKLKEILNARRLDERQKAVVCAEKIAILEAFENVSERNGYYDFDAFAMPEQYQRWYYTYLYRSLTYGFLGIIPKMFERLRDDIDRVFYTSKDETMFETSRVYFMAKAEEISSLKSMKVVDMIPYTIYFSGEDVKEKEYIMYYLYECVNKCGLSTIISTADRAELYKDKYDFVFTAEKSRKKLPGVISFLIPQIGISTVDDYRKSFADCIFSEVKQSYVNAINAKLKLFNNSYSLAG